MAANLNLQFSASLVYVKAEAHSTQLIKLTPRISVVLTAL